MVTSDHHPDKRLMLAHLFANRPLSATIRKSNVVKMNNKIVVKKLTESQQQATTVRKADKPIDSTVI